MREQAQYAQAQRETEEIYSQRSLVQPRDQDVFYSNTHEHFQKESTARGLKQWLNTWNPLLLQSIQDSITTGTNRNHSICDFFPPSQLHDVAKLHLIVVLAPRQRGPGALVDRPSALLSVTQQHLN